MIQVTGGCEAILCAAYREQKECYAHALALAENLSAAMQQGLNTDETLRRINTQLANVTTIENRIQEQKRQWHVSGSKPGPELRHILDEIAHQIQQLIRRVADAERAATTKRNVLAPQLDGLIRGQQMQRAYQAAATGNAEPRK